MNPFLRTASLVLVVAFAPLVALWVRRSEMTHLVWVVPGAGVVALLLFGLWYAVFGRAPARVRLRRCGFALIAFAILGFAASRLLRYEGSVSGSSFPKFAWAWEKTTVPGISPLVEALPSASPPPEGAADLLDFLGPGRDGMGGPPPFGTDWTERPPKPLWHRPIGKGWSSFTVAGPFALTQQQIGDDEHVTCLDLATGRDLWSHATPQTRLLLERAENGGAAMGGDGPRATPTIHGGRVYAMGSTGVVNCLDLETGTLVWSRHLLRDLGAETQKWGMANSPLVLPEESLVVFAGPDRSGPTLVACDLASGETRWIHEGGGASYSSPRLLTLAGARQIVSVNFADVCGLDPATGATLWRHPWPGTFPKVGQPIALTGDRLLVTASYGAGSLLLKIARSTDGGFAVTPLWKSTQMKTKFSSAVVVGEHAYGLDEGRLACIDLATGKRVWKKEKFGFGQHLLFGSWLLVQTEAGEVVLGEVGSAGFAEAARLPALSSMTWNAPAVAGRVLLVRNDREAAVWLLPEP